MLIKIDNEILKWQHFNCHEVDWFKYVCGCWFPYWKWDKYKWRWDVITQDLQKSVIFLFSKAVRDVTTKMNGKFKGAYKIIKMSSFIFPNASYSWGDKFYECHLCRFSRIQVLWWFHKKRKRKRKRKKKKKKKHDAVLS